jgi:hypothetical protein
MGARRGWCAIGLGLILATAGSVAVAAADASPTQVTGSPRERVSRLEADQAHRAVTSGYVTRAKIALERASKLRASGDGANAEVADRAASVWLDAAETLARSVASVSAASSHTLAARSVDRENEAASLELGVLDAGARVERERSLLEEALGNAGRRRAELARLERERSSVAPRVRTADIDGGTSAPGRSTSKAPERTDRAERDGGLELHMPGAPGTSATPGKRGSTPGEESPP